VKESITGVASQIFKNHKEIGINEHKKRKPDYRQAWWITFSSTSISMRHIPSCRNWNLVPTSGISATLSP